MFVLTHLQSDSASFKKRNGELEMVIYVTPNHQIRHKLEIQKLRFLHNMIEENIGFKMVKELSFYHN